MKPRQASPKRHKNINMSCKYVFTRGEKKGSQCPTKVRDGLLCGKHKPRARGPHPEMKRRRAVDQPVKYLPAEFANLVVARQASPKRARQAPPKRARQASPQRARQAPPQRAGQAPKDIHSLDKDFTRLQLAPFLSNADLLALGQTDKYFRDVTKETFSDRKSWPIDTVKRDRNGEVTGVRRVTGVQSLDQIQGIKGLTHLTFGDDFDQPLLADDLPDTLTHLDLGVNYEQPFDATNLPSSLVSLVLGGRTKDEEVVNLQHTKLVEITYGSWYQTPIQPGQLPATLRRLTLGWSYKHPLSPGVLPENLTDLTLGYSYNSPIEPGLLKPQLRRLTLGTRYEAKLTPGSLPTGLTHLTMGRDYDHPLEANVFPSTLTHLTLGHNYDTEIQPGVLPAALTHLYIGDEYNHPINNGILPQTLTHLVFSGSFTRPPLGPDGLLRLKNYHTQFSQYGHSLPTDLYALQYLWLGASFDSPINFYTLPSLEVLVTKHGTFGGRTPAHVQHYQYPLIVR